jgi:uncharacterized protein (TIGR03437 family)
MLDGFRLTPVVGVVLLCATQLHAQVCRIQTSGLNRNRRAEGPVHAECPVSVHTVPFGNWGVTSNFGQKLNDHQFQGWCHDTPICDNRGNCRTECQDGWYEWNSCTDIDEFRAPNCTLFNDKNCTAQATTTGQNVHGTRSVDVTVRCPADTNADGISDQGGCADLKVFSNGTNFMSLYELDPGTTDDLIQTMYFPDTSVSLTCTVFGCLPAQSLWVMPNAYDSPTSPAKVSAEFAMTVNSAIFIDTSRGCRVVGPIVNTVSAASFRGPAVAPESIASAFGSGLAVSVENAAALPLPVDLAGTRVSITDSAGATRPAPLFYVSAEQINFQVPAGTAIGSAQVVISRTDTVTSRGTVQIASVTPGLFAANANGQGVAAATALRVNGNGTTVAVPVFQCGSAPLSCTPTPVALDAGPVYLSLYGTGLRGTGSRPNVIVTIGGASAQVLYAGPQTQYVGLDQVNVIIPATLRGRGTVEVSTSIGSSVSNIVSIAVQ